MTNDLTFQQFSATNRARCMRWHPGFPGDDGWTGADWANAMQGEAGEAGNVVKKLRRDWHLGNGAESADVMRRVWSPSDWERVDS